VNSAGKQCEQWHFEKTTKPGLMPSRGSVLCRERDRGLRNISTREIPRAEAAGVRHQKLNTGTAIVNANVLKTDIFLTS